MPGQSDVSRSGRLTAVRQTVLASNVAFLEAFGRIVLPWVRRCFSSMISDRPK